MNRQPHTDVQLDILTLQPGVHLFQMVIYASYKTSHLTEHGTHRVQISLGSSGAASSRTFRCRTLNPLQSHDYTFTYWDMYVGLIAATRNIVQPLLQHEHCSPLLGRALHRVRSIESLASSLQLSHHCGLLLLALFAYWLQWHYSNFVKCDLITPKIIKI